MLGSRRPRSGVRRLGSSLAAGPGSPNGHESCPGTVALIPPELDSEPAEAWRQNSVFLLDEREERTGSRPELLVARVTWVLQGTRWIPLLPEGP